VGQWRFYQESGRAWRWRQLSDDGKTIKECAASWPTLEGCLRDAQRHGMTSQDAVRFQRENAKRGGRRDKQ
jgi:hypothetical protein